MQGSLGGRYLSGRGMPQDFVLAHIWYNLGAFCQACETSSEKFARLNGIAGVFEYNVNADGSSTGKIWEWT